VRKDGHRNEHSTANHAIFVGKVFVAQFDDLGCPASP